MKQKFRMFTFVQVRADNELPFDGIVEGTDGQLHSSGSEDAWTEYSVYEVHGGVVVDQRAWFGEEQLFALPTQNRLIALDMVEAYLSED